MASPGLNEIDATRHRIQEVREQHQGKEAELQDALDQLKGILDNRKKHTRGGKQMEDRIQKVIGTLQEEVQNCLLNIEALENQLAFQMNGDPSNVGSQQNPPPSAPHTLVDRGHATTPYGGNNEEASPQHPHLSPPHSSVDSGHATTPYCGDNEQMSPPHPHSTSPRDSVDREHMTTPRQLSPPRGLVDVITGGVQRVSEQADREGGVESIEPGVDDSAIISAEQPTTDDKADPKPGVAKPDIPSEALHDDACTILLDTGSQPNLLKASELSMAATQLPQKCPVEDSDGSLERGSKRGRQDEQVKTKVATWKKNDGGSMQRRNPPGPHVSQKNKGESQREGRGIVVARPKKPNHLLEQYLARKSARRTTTSSQHNHKFKKTLKEDKNYQGEDSQGDKGDHKEKSMAMEDEAGARTVRGPTGEVITASIGVVSDAAATVEFFDDDCGGIAPVEDDLRLESMRVANRADMEDMQKRLGEQKVAKQKKVAKQPAPGTRAPRMPKRSGTPVPSPNPQKKTAKQHAAGKKRVSAKGDRSAIPQQGKGSSSEPLSYTESGLGQEDGEPEGEETDIGEGLGQEGSGSDEYKEEREEEETDKGEGLNQEDEGGDEYKEESEEEESSEDEGAGWAPPSRKMWEGFSEGQKARTIAKGRIAIQRFLSDSMKHIPATIRSYIREVPEVLPEASSISRALAIHCLTSKFGNFLCLYHLHRDKRGKINDASPHRDYNVTGVPWERRMNPRDRGHDVPLVTLQHTKSTNCGCHQDEVLWDFYWFKNGHVYSPSLGITETWRTTRLEPRARGLMVQFLETLTCLHLQDVYMGTLDANQARLELLRKMRKNIRQEQKQLKKEILRLAVEPSLSVESD